MLDRCQEAGAAVGGALSSEICRRFFHHSSLCSEESRNEGCCRRHGIRVSTGGVKRCRVIQALYQDVGVLSSGAIRGFGKVRMCELRALNALCCLDRQPFNGTQRCCSKSRSGWKYDFASADTDLPSPEDPRLKTTPAWTACHSAHRPPDTVPSCL